MAINVVLVTVKRGIGVILDNLRVGVILETRIASSGSGVPAVFVTLI